jgi:tetratricopeptide (TPR) repeat protein
VVACAAAFLVLAVAGLAASTLLVWRAQQRAAAGWASAEEAHQAETRQRWRAEANAEMAFEAAERMYTQAFEEWLANQPGLDEAPRRFLRDALAFYERFAAENGANPRVRRQTARAYSRVGRIYDRLGVPGKAEEAFRRAVDLQQALADEFPGEPGCRYDLAVSLMNRVDFLLGLGRLAEAERHCRRAQVLLGQLVKAPRSALYRDGVARMSNALGTICARTGRPLQAAQQYKRSLALARQLRDEAPANPYYRRGLAVVLHNLGGHLKDQGRLREAEGHLRESYDVKRRLVKEFPAVGTYRADLANGLVSLGAVLRQAGRLPQAEEAFGEAVPLWQRLAAEFPRVHDVRHGLARSHHSLGRLLRARRRLPQAEQQLEQALTVLQKLADEVPRVPVYRHDLALGHRDLGDVRREAGRLAEAEPALRRARDLLSKLAGEFPRETRYREALGSAQNNLGGVLTELGRPDEALTAQRAALEVRRGLAKEFPDRPEYRHSVAFSLGNLAFVLRQRGDRAGGVGLLGEAIGHESAARALRPGHAPYRDFLRHLHLFLADTQAGLGRYAEAAKAAAAVPGLAPERWQFACDAASMLTLCARLAARDAALPEDRRRHLAREYAEQAGVWLEEAGRRAADDPKALNDLAWLVAADPNPVAREARRAVEWAGRAVKQRPKVGAFWCTLGVAHYRAGQWRAAVQTLEKARSMLAGPNRCVGTFALAMAQWQAGQHEQARRCYDQAARDAAALTPASRLVQDFRAEAGALLGLPISPSPKSPPAEGTRER